MSLYDDLGVDKDATQKEIKARYKKLSMKHHPDRGGDEDEFVVIQKAYDILGDEKKRKHYDETGEVEGVIDENQKVVSDVSAILIKIIKSSQDLSKVDLVKVIVDATHKVIKMADADIVGMNQNIKILEDVARRFSCKDKDNYMKMMVEGEIKSVERSINGANKVIEHNKKIIEFVSSYEYKVETEMMTMIARDAEQQPSQKAEPGMFGNIFG